MSVKALSHITVVDLSQNVAGAYAAKLMADFGAQVIKIESPQTGAMSRNIDPSCVDQKKVERDIPFLWLNTSKKSVTLNYNCIKGRGILEKIIKKADVLVESFPPKVIKNYKLDYDTLRKTKPSLVQTSISNFGQSGRYRDFEAEEIQLQAMSGMMHMTGEGDKSPLASGPAICHYSAGLHAYTATLMALFQRYKTGHGKHVDLSAQESSMENIEISLSQQLHQKITPKRGPHLGVPWSTYECKDGYGVVISMPARHWHQAHEIFNDPVLFNKKYEHIFGRIENRLEYEERISKCIKKIQKKNLFYEGQKRKLAFGFVADLKEATELEQHEDREFFIEQGHPEGGSFKICGAPFKMSETPAESKKAPLFGEHNKKIYSGMLGYSADELNHLQREGVI